MSKQMKKFLKTIAVIPFIFLLHVLLNNIVSTGLGGYIIRIMVEGAIIFAATVKACIHLGIIIAKNIKEHRQKKVINVDLEFSAQAKCELADEELKRELNIQPLEKKYNEQIKQKFLQRNKAPASKIRLRPNKPKSEIDREINHISKKDNFTR